MKLHIIIAAVATIGLAYCGRSGAGQEAHSHTAPKTIEVKAREMAFAPSAFAVRAGERISLHFENEGRVLHDWTLVPDGGSKVRPAQGHAHKSEDSPHGSDGHRHSVGPGQLHVMAEPGRTARLDFEIAAPGEYEFFCSVPGHREAGMVGRIVVR